MARRNRLKRTLAEKISMGLMGAVIVYSSAVLIQDLRVRHKEYISHLSDIAFRKGDSVAVDTAENFLEATSNNPLERIYFYGERDAAQDYLESLTQ